jgi:prepilin-type N-terminal cleavage/methylation domain-containing protein
VRPEEKEKIKTLIIGKLNSHGYKYQGKLWKLFHNKLRGILYPPLRGIVQLTNFDTLQPAYARLRVRNWSFNKKGFTLIELMLVIMVVGVILFLAVPATRDALTTDKLKKASRQLFGLERKLRVEAVRDQIDYILNFDLPGSVFWITTMDMTAEKIAEVKKNAQHLPEGVIIADIIIGENDQKQTGGEIIIRFTKNNTCTPAVIHLAYEESRMTLTLSPFLGITAD